MLAIVDSRSAARATLRCLTTMISAIAAVLGFASHAVAADWPTRTVTIDLSRMSAPATGQWYDPAAGIYSPISGSPFTNSGVMNFTPPGDNAAGQGDWVLILETPAPAVANPVPGTYNGLFYEADQVRPPRMPVAP